jgi:aldehyde dehydrogenase (NAD+)
LKIVAQLTDVRSTENTIAEAHAATEEDVSKAVNTAKAALTNWPWSGLRGTDRGIMINKLADLIDANKELLASIDARDNDTFASNGLPYPDTS